MESIDDGEDRGETEKPTQLPSSGVDNEWISREESQRQADERNDEQRISDRGGTYTKPCKSLSGFHACAKAGT